jgi:uncharacterized protein YjbI with pentapeptide repeats
MMWPFSAPKSKPVPVVIIRDRLGREIDRVQGWNLERKDLRNQDWRHVDLSGQCLDNSDLSGTNMLGADLRGASLINCTLVGCEISYADASGCDFSGSNMVGCLLYRSDVPKIKVFQTGRVTA